MASGTIPTQSKNLGTPDDAEVAIPFLWQGKQLYYRAMKINSITAGSYSYVQFRASDTNNAGQILACGGYYSASASTIRTLPYGDIAMYGTWAYSSSNWRCRCVVDNQSTGDISNVVLWAIYTHGD